MSPFEKVRLLRTEPNHHNLKEDGMTATMTHVTAKQTTALMKAWRFVFVGQEKNNRRYKYTSGKEVLIPRTGYLNTYQLAELSNLVGVSEEEFLVGKAPEVTTDAEVLLDKVKESRITNYDVKVDVTVDTLPVLSVSDRVRLLDSHRVKIIQFLHTYPGDIMEDKSGRVTGIIAEKVGLSLSRTGFYLRGMEKDLQLERSVDGKRTKIVMLKLDGPGVREALSVTLQPDPEPPEPFEPGWPKTVAGPAPEPEVDPTVAHLEALPVAPEQVTDLSGLLGQTDLSLEKLAMAMLDAWFKTMNARDPERWANERMQLTDRLNQQTEYADQLRRRVTRLESQLQDLTNSLEAAKSELMSLKSEKRSLNGKELTLLAKIARSAT
jgi:hypothetical protein